MDDRAISRWLGEQSWKAFLEGKHDLARELDELSVEAHHGAATRFAIEHELITDPEDDS